MVVLLNIQGKCAHLRAKTVDVSGHLPSGSPYLVGNWAESSTESASMIEFWAEDSIKR
jgi:hypothetical protein